MKTVRIIHCAQRICTHFVKFPTLTNNVKSTCIPTLPLSLGRLCAQADYDAHCYSKNSTPQHALLDCSILTFDGRRQWHEDPMDVACFPIIILLSAFVPMSARLSSLWTRRTVSPFDLTSSCNHKCATSMWFILPIPREVCDCDQDDGRKTVSEQGVQRVTSKSKKETAQTQAQGPLRQTNTGAHENLTKGHRVRKTSARRNARQVPKTHKTNTTNVCAQLLTASWNFFRF